MYAEYTYLSLKCWSIYIDDVINRAKLFFTRFTRMSLERSNFAMFGGNHTRIIIIIHS